jgi:hypothetical protein
VDKGASPTFCTAFGGLVYQITETVRAMQHTGTSNITGFAHVPEAGALCVSDASGRLLMIDTETRAIEEVRRRLHQDD